VYCAACTRHPTTRSCQHDGCSANAQWPEDGGGVCCSPSASASSSSPVALRGSKRCLFEPTAAAAASSGVKAALGEPPNIGTWRAAAASRGGSSRRAGSAAAPTDSCKGVRQRGGGGGHGGGGEVGAGDGGRGEPEAHVPARVHPKSLADGGGLMTAGRRLQRHDGRRLSREPLAMDATPRPDSTGSMLDTPDRRAGKAVFCRGLRARGRVNTSDRSTGSTAAVEHR